MTGPAPPEDRLWLGRPAELSDHRRCLCPPVSYKVVQRRALAACEAVELANGQTAVVCPACEPPACFGHGRACVLCGLRLAHGRPAVVRLRKVSYPLCRQHARSKDELLRRLAQRDARRQARLHVAKQVAPTASPDDLLALARIVKACGNSETPAAIWHLILAAATRALDDETFFS